MEHKMKNRKIKKLRKDYGVHIGYWTKGNGHYAFTRKQLKKIWEKTIKESKVYKTTVPCQELVNIALGFRDVDFITFVALAEERYPQLATTEIVKSWELYAQIRVYA